MSISVTPLVSPVVRPWLRKNHCESMGEVKRVKSIVGVPEHYVMHGLGLSCGCHGWLVQPCLGVSTLPRIRTLSSDKDFAVAKMSTASTSCPDAPGNCVRQSW